MQMMSQQGAGPQSYVGALERMPIEALLQEFNNPGSQFPKFAVLSAMQKKQEQQRMMQAIQGQQAMAQQAQAGPPIAQGVLAGAQQMAAQDQQVPAYNAGGIVALAGGGDPSVEKAKRDLEDAQLRGDREAISNAMRRLAAAYSDVSTLIPRGLAGAIDTALVRPARALTGASIPYLGSVVNTESATPATDEFERERLLRSAYGPGTRNLAAATEAASAAPDIRTQLNRADAAVRSAAADSPTSSSAPRPSAGGAARPPATAAAAAAAQDPFALLEAEQKRRDKERLAGAKTPAEVAAARAEEKRLMEENLRQAMAEAKAARESAEARRERVVGAAKRSILEDPEALLRLAGGMSRKRGEGIGSLAAGAGAELGRRREAIEKAEEKFAGEQKELRTLDAANRQYNISIAQLQRAIAEGDAEKIRAARQDVADAGVKLQEAKLEYGLKARDTASKETQARAAMISAGKPTGQEAMINFFNKDPEGFRRYMEANAGPKAEANEQTMLLRSIITEAAKNPLMLSQYPPEMQAVIKDTLLKLSATNKPTGPTRE